MSSAISSTCQPLTLSANCWRACCPPRCKPTQRSLPTASQATAQQTEVKTKDLSPEDTQKGLQYQLERSAKQAPVAVQQPHQPAEYEKELIIRQRSAREWITPWLTVKARSKSVDTMAALRTSTSGLSAEQQDMALKRLLRQSWQVAAAHPVAVDEAADEESDEEMPNLKD